MMDFHRARIDVRLERGEVVGQWGKCECHVVPPKVPCALRRGAVGLHRCGAPLAQPRDDARQKGKKNDYDDQFVDVRPDAGTERPRKKPMNNIAQTHAMPPIALYNTNVR